MGECIQCVFTLYSCILQAYITLCDLLIVFGRHLYTNYNTLQPLVFEPEKSLQSRLVNFLNDKVFVEDEDGRCIVGKNPN